MISLLKLFKIVYIVFRMQNITQRIKASQIKVGMIVIIQGRPCKVVSISISKTGKHGHCKVHVQFEGQLSHIFPAEELVIVKN